MDRQPDQAAASDWPIGTGRPLHALAHGSQGLAEEPLTAGRYSFYSLTPKATQLLEEGAQRIFQPRADPWDGRWHLLVYSIPEAKRHLRRKLLRRLHWLGFGALNHATWISPRDMHDEVEQVVNALNMHPYVELFAAEHRDFTSDAEIVTRCWNLKRLRRYHAALIARYEPLYEQDKARSKAGRRLQPEACFVRRFKLIEEVPLVSVRGPQSPARTAARGLAGRKSNAVVPGIPRDARGRGGGLCRYGPGEGPQDHGCRKPTVRRRGPKSRASPTRK